MALATGIAGCIPPFGSTSAGQVLVRTATTAVSNYPGAFTVQVIDRETTGIKISARYTVRATTETATDIPRFTERIAGENEGKPFHQVRATTAPPEINGACGMTSDGLGPSSNTFDGFGVPLPITSNPALSSTSTSAMSCTESFSNPVQVRFHGMRAWRVDEHATAKAFAYVNHINLRIYIRRATVDLVGLPADHLLLGLVEKNYGFADLIGTTAGRLTARFAYSAVH